MWLLRTNYLSAKGFRLEAASTGQPKEEAGTPACGDRLTVAIALANTGEEVDRERNESGSSGLDRASQSRRLEQTGACQHE